MGIYLKESVILRIEFRVLSKLGKQCTTEQHSKLFNFFKFRDRISLIVQPTLELVTLLRQPLE